MSTYDKDDSAMENLMSNVPMGEEAPEGLKRKLRVMAIETPARRRFALPMRLAWASAAVAIIAVVAITAMPTQAVAKSYQVVLQAAERITSIQLNMQVIDHGKIQKFAMSASETGYALDIGDGIRMKIDENGMQTYDPAKNELLEVKFPGSMYMKDMMKEAHGAMGDILEELDLKSKLKEFEKDFGKENIKVSPVVQRNGHAVYDITMEKPGEIGRVHITVNAATDLPETITVDSEEGKGPQQMIMEFHYNQGSDINVDFPANAKRTTVDTSMFENGFSPFKENKIKK